MAQRQAVALKGSVFVLSPYVGSQPVAAVCVVDIQTDIVQCNEAATGCGPT